MSGGAAYEGEMSEVALFESALRAAVPTQPDPRIGADLVPRLAEVARTARIAAADGTASAARARRRRRWAPVARVAIAAATIPLLFAGLAAAGVTVPEPARDAFETLGLELPNQPAGDEGEVGPSTKDQAPGTSGAPGAPASGDLPPKANAKAKERVKAKSENGDKPGRRVRRYGDGQLPGPASPPEGRALGYANQGTGSGNSASAGGGSEKGGGSANAGESKSNRGGSAGG